MEEKRHILITLLMPEGNIPNNIHTEQDIIRRIGSLLSKYYINGQIRKYIVCDDELISEGLKNEENLC